MPHLSECPAPHDLERFLLGHGNDDEAASIERHLDECPRCADQLSGLRGGDELIDAMRHAVPSGGDQPPQVSTLIERLVALPAPTADTAIDYSFLSPTDSADELGYLGSYRVLRLLGTGGMGMVFLAEDSLLRRPVALKVMRPELLGDAAQRARFLGEARKAAAVAHDHVVTVYQVGEDRGVPFLAMQLLDGETLEQRLTRESRLPAAEAVRITRELAEGLAAAHALGLIHRDIKPANLWLERAGGRVKLLDFGLARAIEGDSVHSRTGTIVGTPAYMAPEQARGAPEQVSDLFSVGCVLYRMLTGKPPFAGPDVVAVLLAVAQDAPAPPSAVNAEVPPELSDLTMHLLAKSPPERPTAAAVIAALSPSPKRPRRGTLVAALLASTALVVVAGVVIKIRHRDGSVTKIKTDGEVSVEKDGHEVTRVAITPEKAAPLAEGAPLGPFALVQHPAPLPGARSWTLETRGHRGSVLAAAYSPDGRWLATAGNDGTTRVWDARTRELSRCLVGQRPQVHALTWSPDSRALASLSDDEVRIWDVPEGRLLRRLPSSRVENPLRGVAWSADGATLAAGEMYRGVVLWDPRDGAPRRTLPCSIHTEGQVVAITPDSRTVAVANREHEVALWDAVTGRVRHTLKGHTKSVWAIAYAPGGKTIASAASDGTIRLWDAATGTAGHVLVEDRQGGTDNSLSALAWSPDGRRLFTVSRHRAASLWDAATGKKLASPANGAQEYKAAGWSPDGATLNAAGDRGHVEYWDAMTLRRLPHEPGHFTPADFSAAIAPDGKSLAVSDRTVRVWRLDESSAPRELPSLGDHGGRLVWSPDGQRLVGGTSFGHGFVRLWDLASGEQRDLLAPSPRRVFGLAWSPDGRRVAAGGTDKVVYMWDAASGKRLRSLDGSEQPINGLAWSPTGDRLASLHPESVVIWDVKNGRRERVLKHPNNWYWAAWSKDGRTLAAGGTRPLVQVWDAGTGEALGTLESPRPISGFVSWLADGKTLIGSSHGWLDAWNTETHRLLRSYPMPRVTGVTADRKTLVTAQAGVAAIWDAETGRGRGSLVSLRDDRWAMIAPGGQFRGASLPEAELVAVVQTDDGQQTLTLEQLAGKYGWKNDPTGVRLAP